jgi:hypothetical protein
MYYTTFKLIIGYYQQKVESVLYYRFSYVQMFCCQ